MMKRPAQICQIPATMHKGVIVMQHQKPKNMATERENLYLYQNIWWRLLYHHVLEIWKSEPDKVLIFSK